MRRKVIALRTIAAVSIWVLVAGVRPAQADWISTTGGQYGSLDNWTDSTINNVFFASDYTGGDQFIWLYSDAVWNAEAPVVTAHANDATLYLFPPTGSDRNLVLGAGIHHQATGEGEIKSRVQFGTANAKINFTLPETVTIHADSDRCWYPQVIVNGAVAGAGGLSKTGHGSLYLQNAASLFTGALNIGAGQVVLASAGATLATTNIVRLFRKICG